MPECFMVNWLFDTGGIFWVISDNQSDISAIIRPFQVWGSNNLILHYTIFNSHLYREIYREIYIFRYKEKLTLNDGTIITDPYGLSNIWKNNVLLLPDISWADIHNYINTPSAYLMKTWKLINHLKFLIFCMQSCSRYVLSLCFKRINVLLCQNKGKSEIVWFGKCLWMSSIFG